MNFFKIELHIAISMQRSLIGFGLGMLIAIPLGLIIGWFKWFEFYIDPLLQTFRQTPTFALLPVFMFLFGIGEISKVAIAFWGVQWAILLNTMSIIGLIINYRYRCLSE